MKNIVVASICRDRVFYKLDPRTKIIGVIVLMIAILLEIPPETIAWRCFDALGRLSIKRM